LDNLWQTTCFELFIAESGKSNYWEFNFSPSTEWNCYRFSEYRNGMEIESFYDMINISVDNMRGKFTLHTNFEFPFINSDDNYEIQIAAVIELINKKLNYFSIDNSRTKPDFHQRKYFLKSKNINSKKSV